MITKKDVENIPALRQLREAIATWDNIAKTTSGRDAYIAKSAAIELRKDQYLIKDSYYVPNTLITSQQTVYPPKMDESVTLDERLSCHPSGVSFLNPKVVEHILCDYPALKAAAYGKFDHDIWAIMHDFDNLCGRALREYPLYERLVEYKIDNLSNEKIAEKLQEEFGILHTDSHLSTLWRKKIPELIAAQAEEEYLFWYCENISSSDDDWKTCTRCNKKKPANENFFSRNTGTKSGFYSICKKCRNESYHAKKKTTKGGI